jgi:predicted hotdog family 3-hydroxylacyl-ACP dehydratase
MDMRSIPVGELVPHGPRITVIDELVSYDAKRSSAIASVRADSVFLEGDGVPAWAGIEYMAQTIAAHAGAEARLRGARPAIGFLLGTRAYRCDVPEFPLGSRLTIVVEPLWSERGVAAFDCSIRIDDGALVAAAVINAYVPGEDELARLRAQELPS